MTKIYRILHAYTRLTRVMREKQVNLREQFPVKRDKGSANGFAPLGKPFRRQPIIVQVATDAISDEFRSIVYLNTPITLGDRSRFPCSALRPEQNARA